MPSQQAYEAGLKQLPDNEMLLYSMAALDERQGQFDRAIGRYEEFMKRKPDSAMARHRIEKVTATRICFESSARGS